jgi:hypothetical protein
MVREEGVPGGGVVGVLVGVHPLLRRELAVVVVGDGQPTVSTLREGGTGVPPALNLHP